MLKDKGLDPTILALLQRSSLDVDREQPDNSDDAVTDTNSLDYIRPNQISLSEELRRQGLEKWLEILRIIMHQIAIKVINATHQQASTPERAWVLFSFIVILETVIVAVILPKTIKVINATHQQFEFGFSVLLLSLVVCSIMAFLQSLQAEEMAIASRHRKDLAYKGWTGGQQNFSSPYASTVYLCWAMASAFALVVAGVLPIVSWFATYRFSLSSAICIGIFAAS